MTNPPWPQGMPRPLRFNKSLINNILSSTKAVIAVEGKFTKYLNIYNKVSMSYRVSSTVTREYFEYQSGTNSILHWAKNNRYRSKKKE